MNFVFALVLILAPNGQILGHGGTEVADMEACHALVKKTLENIQLPEGARAQSFCLNTKPLPTDTNVFQPAPAVTI